MRLLSFGSGTLLLAILAFLSSGRVHAAAVTESQLEAVFLFNFAVFVEWPPETFPDTKAPFIIGVLGRDPFGDFLDETVRGEEVNGHPMIVRRFRRLAEVDRCQILFISGSKENQLATILPTLQDRGMLTAGDAPSFARRGGMIGFALVDHKIRLRINVEAAREARLTISSKLLRAAEIVSTDQE